ncbi:MAG: ComF family protein [Deltaproteobacteria bacterium]
MLNELINILIPPVCALCERGAAKTAFCQRCEAEFEKKRITGPACVSCCMPFPSKEAPAHRCSSCIRSEPPFSVAWSAYRYDSILLDAVHGLKYSGTTILAKGLGDLLARAITARLPGRFDLIAPVPLHPKRLKDRGFNQSLLIARRISKLLGTPLDCFNLVRVMETEPQVNLRAKERKNNVRGAFAIKNSAVFKGRRVLLVDDVYTTGATLCECSKALKKAGAEVFAATLARAAV